MTDLPTTAHIQGVHIDSSTTFADLTTLRLGGRPRAIYRCTSATAICEVVSLLDDAGIPLLIVGGGSNLVVADGELDVAAVVVDNQDMHFGEDGVVTVDAGVEWDTVVAESVKRGLGGIECLSGIPGSAGATPVQNVGAYGAEIADVLVDVQLFDREQRTCEWVDASTLELGYRYSNLKFTSRAVVLALRLKLSTDGLSAPLRFGQLSGEPGSRRPVAQVREEVLALRASKSMVLDPDDPDTWSAGSFFTNPIVDPARVERIRERVEALHGEEAAQSMPAWDTEDGRVKLSAAWLIERAGFPKGFPGEDAPARLSTKHTLALTNRGNARSSDLVALARRVRAGVQDVFGVSIEPEPVWVGVSIEE